MGNFVTKPKPLLPICEIEEHRTPQQLKEQEKYYEDCEEQYRIIEEMLQKDEAKYAEEINQYRIKHNVYVITDRDIILRGGELRNRRYIKW